VITAPSTSVPQYRHGRKIGESGLNTINLVSLNKSIILNGSIGQYAMNGYQTTIGLTWQKCKTLQRSGCGLTPMTAKNGLGRVHTKAANVHGCVTFLLLTPLQKRRILIRHLQRNGRLDFQLVHCLGYLTNFLKNKSI